MRVVDLTRPLDERTVLWPGSVPFVAEEEHDEDGFWWRNLSLPEHSGTHLDAPCHLIPGGAAVDDIPAERLVRPAVRIDLPERSRDLATGDVEAWEEEHGRVPEGVAVLLRTGWDGDALAAPGYGRGAGELLVGRGAVGLGIDTLSVDAVAAKDFPVHHVALGAGLWQLEGLAGLGAVPPTGATLVVGALRLARGSGTPARVFALLP